MIARVGQPMQNRLMESPVWCRHSGSLLWGKAEEGDNVVAWPLEFLSRRKLSPSFLLDSFSLYATGALPAGVPVLEPRGSEFA